MRKLAKFSILAVSLVFLSACDVKEDNEIVSIKDFPYVVYCDSYAIVYETNDNDININGNLVLYESMDYGNYKRKFAFDAAFEFANRALVVGNKAFIIHPEYIQSYSLEDGKMMDSHGGIGGDGTYIDVYGIKNERVYLSYQPGDKIIYYTLDMNLKNKEIIDKEEMPKQFDYEVCGLGKAD